MFLIFNRWFCACAIGGGLAAFVAAELAAPAPVNHWAFQALERPRVPATAGSEGAIDSFIAAKLAEKRLATSPEADRPTLIRRLWFDVLGLPPTPEKIAAFANDPDPRAWERLVDETLASPQFGERWARHWLDVVRFAESDGFETNQPRPNAWRYRDYVIQTFNADKPWTEFICEQLAGDALGADAATGFIVGGAYDRVKSPDPVLTAQQRADELDDMVGTTGAAFLGLTVNCARCHDHKFDPISSTDYYAMTACFTGVQHGERPVTTAVPYDQARRIASLRAELDSARARADALVPSAREAGRPPVNPRRNIERFEHPERARFLRFTALATNSGIEPCLDEIEVLAPSGENVALATSGLKISSSGNYVGDPKHRLEHLNDGRHGNDFSWISNTAGAGWVELEWPAEISIARVVWGRDLEEKYSDRLAIQYRIEGATEPGQWRTIASSETRQPWQPGIVRGESPDIQELVKRLGEIAQQPMAYAGNFSAPPPTHRLHRGDPMQPREAVAPGGLVRFGPAFSVASTAAERERRFALARWISDARHPLTARVIANRLWHYHFGTGIVDTPSDFGLNGTRPTHPELLDWLASEFIAQGWRLKPIHRLILLSKTYRQSSAIHPEGLRADSNSRFLWRFPPWRLGAEPLRDAILAVSGKLDARMGGPGFDLFEPNTNYVKVYTTKTRFSEADFRRMIYQSKPRVELDTLFGAFDCPDAGQPAPRRTSSTTPLQALNLLNSEFILEQAGFFAQRLRREAGVKPQAQAQRAFLLAFGRHPTDAEVQAAIVLIRDHGLLMLCRALYNANEFITVH